MVIHSKLHVSEMKRKILTARLQGNYGDSLGEFNNTDDMLGAEVVFSKKFALGSLQRV